MRFRSLPRLSLALALVLAGTGSIVVAQDDGDQNPSLAPDSTGSFEVGGVEVDVAAKTADAARQGGWRIAQRKAWTMLAQRLTGHGSTLSDGALDGLVTGIMVESEYIGPSRYIARLGVLFDRGRSASILGVAGQYRRSSPMLVIPIEWSGGVGRSFERTSPWVAAWQRFRSGESSIDYVRPSGTGPDGLLLNVGQAYRRGRGWWRAILDQYGADDILIPEVRLRREWPGGPIIGTFTANHGPDNERLAQFSLRVSSGDSLDALLDAGIRRLDQAYQQALGAGELKTDKLLGWRPPKQPEATDDQGDNSTEAVPVEQPGAEATAPAAATTQGYSIQFDTPTAGSVAAGEASIRGIPGVRSANTTSLALGGISIMRVNFDGSQTDLTTALQSRGWQVQQGAGVLRIRRPFNGAPPAGVGSGDQGGG